MCVCYQDQDSGQALAHKDLQHTADKTFVTDTESKTTFAKSKEHKDNAWETDKYCKGLQFDVSALIEK